MSRKRPEGLCHICGKFGPLSFEHVPPKAAFNDRPVIEATFNELIQLGLDERPRGRINQRGAGGYTLCERCNNLTGKWYARRFVAWCYQGMDILIRSGGNPTLFYLNYLFPLAIIKQIITMFFSINGPNFADSNPELVDFVLNRDRKYLSPQYRIFVYYNTLGHTRQAPIAGIARLSTGQAIILTEITYPPFGYVMTFDCPPPDQRLVDISHFARYDYEEFVVQELRLPTLPTHLMYPGDYRTKNEILQQQSNGEQMPRHG